MVEELNVVLEGKPTIIKNKNYKSTKEYIEPFINKLKPLGAIFKCFVKSTDQPSVTNGNVDTVYNRVCIQAVLPPTYYQQGDYQKAICMVYALDSKIPVAKFYIGNIHMKYGTIVVTDESQVHMQKIEPDTALDYSSIQQLLELTDTIHSTMEPNLSLLIEKEDLLPSLGFWIDRTLDYTYSSEYGKVKIANSTSIDVYKSIVKDKDSEWYVSSTDNIYIRDIYNSFLYLVQKDDKDIVNQFEKTMLVNKILGL